MGRTASIVPTCASACFPVPMMAITLASFLAIQSAATPEMPPVRRLPRAKASITATREPSSALHRSSSVQVVLSILQQGLRHIVRVAAGFLAQRGLEGDDRFLQVHQLDDFGLGDPDRVGAHFQTLNEANTCLGNSSSSSRRRWHTPCSNAKSTKA